MLNKMLDPKKRPIILANGPPKSGKDYIETLLAPHFNIIRFALITPVKYATMAAYGLTDAGYTLEDMEKRKDEPLAVFKGKTFRQTVIRTAETYRAMYGMRHWAETLVRVIRAYDMEMNKQRAGLSLIHISDLGFPAEADVFADSFPDRTMLIRCHRYGATFGKYPGYEEAYGENTGLDSRNWVFSTRLPEVDWTNEGPEPRHNVHDLIQHMKPHMDAKLMSLIAMERGDKFIIGSRMASGFKVPQVKKAEPFTAPTQYWPNLELHKGPIALPPKLIGEVVNS